MPARVKHRVWLMASWAEAERLARGELPRSVQRRVARLLKGAALPPALRSTNGDGQRASKSEILLQGMNEKHPAGKP